MLKRFLDLEQKKAGSPEELLLVWRKRIFFIIFLSSLIGALIPYLLNIRLTLFSGNLYNAAIYSLAYLFGIIIIFGKAIPFTLRAWLGLLLFYFMGVVGLISYGPAASGRMWLFMFATLTSLILGLRSGIIAVALNLATILLWALGWANGYFQWQETTQFSTRLIYATVSSFIFMTALVSISIGVFLKFLKKGLQREQKLSNELRQSNENLLKENRERKTAQESKRESEEIFSGFIAQLPGMVSIKDHKRRYRFLNDQCLDFFNLRLDDVVGKTAEEIHTPEKAADYSETDEKVLNTGQSVTVSEEIKGPGGQRTVLRKYKFLIQRTSRPPLVAGIYLDITESKLAEERLRVSEERFKLAIEGSKDGIWDWNLITNEDFHSEQYARMLGYEPEELPQTNSTWSGLLHPADREAALRRVGDYLQGKTEIYESTYRMRAKDGTYRWITGRGKCLFDDKGTPVRFIGFNTDITERKLAEEALRQSEAKFRLVVERANEGIAVIQDNRYKFVNDYMLDIFKMSREQVLSSQLMAMVHSDDRRLLMDRVQKRMAGQPVPEVVEHRIIDGVGNLRWVEARGVLSDWGGRPAIISFATDITERKRYKVSLKQSETRFRNLVEMAPEPIFVHHDGEVLYANSAFCCTLGITSVEDLQNIKIWEIVAPEGVALAKKTYFYATAAG